uniref:Fibronectin type-III domain-containing protein n=1 Tax=Plectus sambesii TaxID=2011161 RepID=A0A914WSJ0_9BILA
MGNVTAVPLPRGELSWGNDPFLKCNYSCHVAACQTGCAGLRPPTEDCDQRCSTTGADDSCRQGCHAVLDSILRRIQVVLNTVQAASTFVQGQGLRVDWTFEQGFSPVIGQIAPNVSWYTQHRSLRRSSPSGWRWTAVGAQGFRGDPPRTTVFLPDVDDEEIEIRLAVSFKSHVLASSSSTQKIDAAASPPQKPVISASLQIRDDQYLICWDEFLKVKRSYRIALFDAEDEEVYSDTVESVCHAFRHLIPGASYRATITDSRVKDSTATQSVHVELQKLDTAEKKSESLLLANSTHIFFLDSVDDYLLGTDPVELPLRLPENEKIAAIAAAAVNQIFIGTSQGKIFRRELGSDDPLAEEIGAPSTDGAPIKQLAVDFMQEKVYALFNDQVIRCDFLTCANETASSIKGVAQLAIDSWNGYIYYLNTQGLLFAQPLFPLTDQLAQLGDTHTPEAIVLPSPAAAITVDYVVGQLVIILQNGSAYGYDLVDHSLKNMRESRLSKQSYADVVRLVAKNGRLFYSSKCTSHPSGVCLYGEEQKPDTNAKGEHLLNLNPYLYSGELVDLSWLGDFERPVTVPQPASVGLITSATSAKVTWENPKLYPFQAPSDTWRRLQYECDLTAEGAEETPEHFLNITGNEQLISAISFGVGYRANVRVCWRSVCSPYANSSSAAFAPYQENPVITYAKVNDKFEALGVLGEKLTSVSVKPEQLPTKADESVVFDSFTGNIYRSNGSESTVEWVNDSGEVIGRINSAGVRWLSLMPNRAILLAASRYSVVAYRLLGTIEQQFYTCESNVTECAQVVGMATDDASGEVFFLLEDSKGAIQLFTASQDVQQPYLVATVTNFPRITQLLVVKEKLMFVTEDGKVGFCDKALGNININYATTNIVQIALNLTYTANEQSFEFDGPIAMGSSQRHEVKWYVKPQFIRGKILYKITMHRGPSDPNPFVDAAISHQYFIPSELLDEWDSKQKFDVVIDAITPWARKSVNGTGLFAPSKPPTAPLHPKLFVTQQMTPDGQRAFVQFAWQEPKEWNGQPFGYSVKCMEDEVLSQLENVTRVKMYSFAVKPGAQVSCQVAATNEPFEFDTIGVYTTAVKADSNNLNPLIKLFAIDATDNLVEVENWLNATTKRRKRRQAPSVTQAVDFIDDKLFAIRKESASQQLFLLQMSTVDVDSLLLKVSIKGDVGQVLGMASDWLANRLLVVGNGNIYRIDLDDLKSASLVMPRKLLALSSSARDAKDLLFDPFTNTAYILTTSNALIAVDLHTSTEENLSVTIDCLKEKPLKAIAAEFIWNSPKSPFIYALSSTGLIHFNPTAKECTDVEVDWSQITGGIDAVSSLSLADKDLIFGTPTGVTLYNSTSQKSSDVPAKNAPFKSILAVSQASQPYPDRSCFELPPGGDIDFSVKNRGRSGAIVTVTPPTTAAACQDLSLPQTEYEVLFKRRDSEKTKHVTSFENTIQINEDVLDLDTDYEVAVTWRNRFSQPKDLSRTKPLTTGFGYPSAPKSAQAYSLSPDTILVFWSLPDRPNAPLDELRYRITVQSSTQAAAAAGGIAYADGKFAAASSPN